MARLTGKGSYCRDGIVTAEIVTVERGEGWGCESNSVAVYVDPRSADCSMLICGDSIRSRR